MKEKYIMLMKGKVQTQVDMINGGVLKSLLLFMLPILGSNIFQQLYNTMDTVIVGHTLGAGSLAAMGACTPVYDVVIGFALGVGNGLSMITARSFGRADMDGLKRSVAASIVIGAALTLVLTVIVNLALGPFLMLLNTPEEIIAESYSYISVITLFMGVMFAYNLCAGLLRAVGNSFMPLAFLVFSSCANIALDFLFINGFGMGVQGAAVATVVSQGASVILCIIYIARKCRILVPEKRHFAPDADMYKELAQQGFSMGFMNSIVYAGTAILQPSINGLGTLTIAGHTAARKIFMFCVMPITSMAQTLNVFASQNMGANRSERIFKAQKYAYLFDTAIVIFLIAVMYLAAPQLIRIISGSEDAVVLQNGTRYLHITSPFFLALAVVDNCRLSLQGLGEKLIPLISSATELVCKIIFALAFIPRFGYIAVIWCEPVIWCIMAAELAYSFCKNSYVTTNRRAKYAAQS